MVVVVVVVVCVCVCVCLRRGGDAYSAYSGSKSIFYPKNVFIPNKTYFANPTERITWSYLSVLLNALRKVVIAIQIVLVKIFLGSVLQDTIAHFGKQKILLSVLMEEKVRNKFNTSIRSNCLDESQ